MKRRLFGIMLSIALISGMMPVLGLSTPSYAAETTTVTWKGDDLKNPEKAGERYVVTKDNITLNAEGINVDGSGNVEIQSNNSDGTFTLDGGLITKVVISGANISGFDGPGWSYIYGRDYVTWTGDPGSSSVAFRGHIDHVKTIEFTIGPALVEYPVWVGDKRVTNYNENDVFGNGKVEFKPSVSGGSATLILNGFSSRVDSSHENCGIYIGAGVPDLVIHLQGDNDVRGSGLYGRGVYSESGNLTFTGDGTLNAYGQNSGIYASGGNLSVRGATLEASSGNYNGYGIYTGSNVTIYSGAVTASATAGNESYGIYARGGTVTIKGNGSSVIAAGGRQAIYDVVKNADAGVGWMDVKGTSAENTIDIDREGQRLWMFKKVQFPAYSGEPDDPDPAPAPSNEPSTASDPTAAGTVHGADGSIYSVTGADTVLLVKAKNGKTFKVPAAVTLYGKPFVVSGIHAGAFRGTKVKTVTVKTRYLSKGSVRNSLKGSKVSTVKVKVGSKKANRKYVKKYKKIFTKKNCGKKVRVSL